MAVVVCSTRYVSHKPKCTRVYKYRITLGPWFDRARYTLKTAQVKPLLCLGRMQTMKTPVYNSVWLAWTACVFICALCLYFRVVSCYRALISIHRCNLRTEGRIILCGSVCEHTHTCVSIYMSVRVCVHVSGHVVGSEGEQELTDMLTSQNTLWCINIHTRLCTLINLPREAASCTSTWFGQRRTAALDFDFLLVSTVLGAGLIGAAFDEFKDERVCQITSTALKCLI